MQKTKNGAKYVAINGVQTVDKRRLYKRVNDTGSGMVYAATNVGGKRKYVVYTGKRVKMIRQVGGLQPNTPPLYQRTI